MAKKTSFVGQVYDYLYPKKNRVIAAVAFVRTFKQTFTGASVVGGTGLVAVNAQDIASLNWDIVLYTVIAMVLTATISAVAAFDDVSRNGLNSKYMDAAAVIEPPVVISADAVKTAIQKTRPAGFIPAPAPAPAADAQPEVKAPATAKKPTSRKVSTKAKAKDVLKVEQAPAVEIAE